MSVIKSQRSNSAVEFLHTARVQKVKATTSQFIGVKSICVTISESMARTAIF